MDKVAAKSGALTVQTLHIYTCFVFILCLSLFEARPVKTSIQQHRSTMPKKGASAEVSRGTEDLIMGVLRAREGGLDRNADKKSSGGKATTRQLCKIWDELIKLGFDESHAEMALRNAPAATLPAVHSLMFCKRCVSYLLVQK